MILGGLAAWHGTTMLAEALEWVHSRMPMEALAACVALCRD